jgi:hypothetical protein
MRYGFPSLFLLCAAWAPAQQSIPLDPAKGLKAVNAKLEAVMHRGRPALRVTEASASGKEDQFAIVESTSDFSDGTIELELSGRPGAGASGQARGFVGVAFRIAADVSKFECFYLRPTNGRAEDQVRRNHSAQYISFPEFPWMRLRKETPEKYESYVDLEPDAWTKVKIEVKGETARLYVHGGAQPTLIVNDLKHGAGSRGAIGLWIGPGTEAHFTNLRVTAGAK